MEETLEKIVVNNIAACGEDRKVTSPLLTNLWVFLWVCASSWDFINLNSVYVTSTDHQPMKSLKNAPQMNKFHVLLILVLMIGTCKYSLMLNVSSVLSRHGNVTWEHVTCPHCPCHVRTMQQTKIKIKKLQVIISILFYKVVVCNCRFVKIGTPLHQTTTNCQLKMRTTCMLELQRMILISEMIN